MFEARDVPYRRWRAGRGGITYLVQSAQSRRLMAAMFRAMRAGKAVEFSTQMTGINTQDHGLVYDTISLTITD